MRKKRKCLYAILMAVLLMVTSIENPFNSIVYAADDTDTVSGNGAVVEIGRAHV